MYFSSRSPRIQSEYVLPSDPQAQGYRTELTGFDVSFFLLNDVPVIWVWKDRWIDYTALRSGLVKTLNRIPAAAGRIRAGDSVIEISVLESDGAVLEFQDCSKSQYLPSESAGTAQWRYRTSRAAARDSLR